MFKAIYVKPAASGLPTFDCASVTADRRVWALHIWTTDENGQRRLDRRLVDYWTAENELAKRHGAANLDFVKSEWASR